MFLAYRYSDDPKELEAEKLARNRWFGGPNYQT